MLMHNMISKHPSLSAALAYTEQTGTAVIGVALSGCVWQCGSDKDKDLMRMLN